MKVDKVNLRLNGENVKSGYESRLEEPDPEATKRKEEKIIRSWCSFQNKMGPPEYRKWRRIHGLQLPLHPQQVTGWIIFLAVGAATFLVLIPALRPFFRDCLFIVLAVLFSLHILSHLAALLLDPADPELRELKERFAVPEFDRSKHAHVIENGRCHLCNIKTAGPKTKHCSVCNKCVDHFDHHCKWLNHCIGGRNYLPFLICVVSAVAASLLVVGVSVLEVVYYHVDPGLLSIFPDSQNGTTPVLFLPHSVFLGIVSILGLLAAATAGLLLHLCLFHCYISVLGITTYEYIRNYRQEASAHRDLLLNCNYKKSKVFSNQMEASQERIRHLKFENCCYYSCSRPPEEEQKYCSGAKFSLTRTKKFLQGGDRKKPTLERQNTDPEFVDKVIKPFLITLSDEKNVETSSKDFDSEHSFINSDSKCKCGRYGCTTNNDKSYSDESNGECSKVSKKIPGLSIAKWQNWNFKIPRHHSTGSTEAHGKIKSNQIRPSTAQEVNNRKGNELTLRREYKPEALDLKSFQAMQTLVLPELNESLKKLKSVAELQQLNNVLEFVEESNFAFNVATDFSKTRKKNIIKRPRSPLLSPIKESGLSNPGSPRVDLITPPTPIFVRPPTPETSTIFLSNPNSSSSSDNDEDDVVSPPIPIIHRHYESNNILRTPQLPRKTFLPPKEEQIFVLKPSKSKIGKWIDLEIKN